MLQPDIFWSQVHSVPNVVNVDQDSSSEDEAETNKGPSARTGGVKLLLSYYGPPEHKKGEVSVLLYKKPVSLWLILIQCLQTGPFKRLYPCLWCKEVFTRGRKTNSNLYGHRDGEPDRLPCPGRKRAIKAGMKLPPTYQESQKAKMAETASGQMMQAFINKPKFSVEILNVILVIWIVRHAIAWQRFSDFTLRAAFKLSNPGADMWSPTWAAKTAKRLYNSLHSAVLQRVLVSLIF